MKIKLNVEVEIPDSATEFGKQVGKYICVEDHEEDGDLEYQITLLMDDQIKDHWDSIVDFSSIPDKYRTDYQISINKIKTDYQTIINKFKNI